jgi:hypothetical protein
VSSPASLAIDKAVNNWPEVQRHGWSYPLSINMLYCCSGMAGTDASAGPLTLDAALSEDLLLRVLDCLGAADLLTRAAPVCRRW